MRQIKKGSTNVSVELLILDSTDGTPETGVLWNASGMDLNYRRDGENTTSITEKALTTPALTDAHDDGGFLEIANGRYRLDVPDAAFATGADQVTIGGAVAGMVVVPLHIQLVNFDPSDGVRLGLSALPNADADAAGGLPVSDVGGLDMDSIISKLDVIDGIVDSILVDTGTTLPATIAIIDSNVDAILVDTGTTLPATLTTIDGKLDTIDGIVDSILVDTGTTLPATLTTMDGKLDTIDGIVDDILVDTGTTLPATLTTIDGKIDTIDGIVDSILVDTGTTIPGLFVTYGLDHFGSMIEDSGGWRFLAHALSEAPSSVGSGLTALASGTAQGPGSGSNQIQLAAASSFADDAIVGNIIKLIGGTGAGQSARVVDWDLASDTATMHKDWVTAPDATTTYEMVEGPGDPVDANLVSATIPAATILAVQNGSAINIRRGDTVTFTITGLDLSDAVDYWFVGKKDVNVAKDAETIKIKNTTGILIVEGSAPDSPSNGSIALLTSTSATVTIKAVECAKFQTFNDGFWAVQVKDSTGAVTEQQLGKLNVIVDYVIET